MFGLISSQADLAWASTFKVAPIKVYLTAQSPTALLTLTNTTDQALRFQISAFSWSQSRNGELELQPTDNIVFFPALLSLKAGEERNVRVGFTGQTAHAVEQSFRIFFEELPAADASSDSSGAQIKVLTKMGIPIFVTPKGSAPQVVMEAVSWKERSLGFTVENRGNSHFTIRSVKVTGRDQSGSTIFSRQYEGWYVLSGGTREYVASVDPEECAKVKEIEVQLSTDVAGEEASGRSVRWKAPAGFCEASS